MTKTGISVFDIFLGALLTIGIILSTKRTLMMCFNPEKKMSFFSVISNKLDGDMLVTMVKSMELLLHKGKYHLLYL